MYKKSKLNIDFNRVEYAKGIAREIAANVQSFVDDYTTVAVERTLCRLVGIDNVDENGVPLPNVVVEQIQNAGALNRGVLYFLGCAILEQNATPMQIAEKIALGEIDITQSRQQPSEVIEKTLQPYIDASIN